MKQPHALLFFILSLFFITSCTISKKIYRQANKFLLNDSVINTGHIGISIYDLTANKYLYNYDADKFFIPASNTKLFTLYAGLKYLGDSLAGLRYIENSKEIIIEGTGDPTLLHPGFTTQKVFDFISRSNKKISLIHTPWQFKPLGNGWAWDDYNEKYMVERSEIPAFGNVVKINLVDHSLKVFPNEDNIILFPLYDTFDNKFKLERGKADNFINIYPAKDSFTEAIIPLANVERGVQSILQNAFQKEIGISSLKYLPATAKVIRSQPVDSLFKPMMFKSDNFFAEQTLLMVSKERLGYMNDETIIDTLLKDDFKNIPQKPRWVDGCGLSRYNLFTPQSFIYLLDKLQKEFGMERIKQILPTGGDGTLKNYFINDSLFIYAKTGSFSNNNNLSGYLITKKKHTIAFSIMVNNFKGSTTEVRRRVELFIEEIRKKH